MLLVALLVTAACGGGGDDVTAEAGAVVDVEVRPFSEVQDGEWTVEADPSDPSRVIFSVATTEPMICAVVWGEDESFGRMNNSLAMDGTGIIDHDVVLPDVEPGREYRFVLQGTTADGTLYRSEVATFTIDEPDAPAGADPEAEVGDNLAVGATVVEASSSFSDAFAPENAIDDDGSTEWATDGDGDDAFLTLDLGEEREIGAVELVTRSMPDGSAIAESFTVTVDGGATEGPFPTGTPADRHIAELEASGREVRVDVATSTGGNVGAVEVRVYAPA